MRTLRDVRTGDAVMVRVTRYMDRQLARLAARRAARLVGWLDDGTAIVEFEPNTVARCAPRYRVHRHLLSLLPTDTALLPVAQVIPPAAFAEAPDADVVERAGFRGGDRRHNGDPVGGVLLADHS